MNKVFKVVWSESTGTWVAVSEIVKAHGKTKSNTNAVAKTASLVVMSIGAALSVQASYAAVAIGSTLSLIHI